MNDLLSDPQIRPYLDEIRHWYGSMKFLGLPTIQDIADTPLSELFIPPQLSFSRVDVELDNNEWPKGQDVLSLIANNHRLVILGDPGSGKSTIVSWLSWLFAGGAAIRMNKALANSLPIPLVARELQLTSVSGFDSLLRAFLARPESRKLSDSGVEAAVNLLKEKLSSGKALLLVDGLDEVPLSARKLLRNAIQEGWRRFPNSHFVVTSRFVGYDECPLTSPQLEIEAITDLTRLTAQQRRQAFSQVADKTSHQEAVTSHVMPFDDERIAAYARQWYRLRSIELTAEIDAAGFIRAVHSDMSVLALARTPQLLTLMALIYRIRAKLPDGRAVLYDMITEAYLESIDRARELQDSFVDPYPWREKRRWLARVGFEMQFLRTKLTKQGRSNQKIRTKSPEGYSDNRDLLVRRETVLGWIGDAMTQSGYSPDTEFVSTYLNWVARRSGLLIPRGDDQFAFVHLSFQEFFCSLYIADYVADADWVIAQRTAESYADGDDRITTKALRTWAQERIWQESLVFLFENFAHKPKDARRLLGWIYGESLSDFKPQPVSTAVSATEFRQVPDSARGELLSRIILNPHSGLPESDREYAVLKVFEFIAESEGRLNKQGTLLMNRTSALHRVLSNESNRQKWWSFVKEKNPLALDLSDSIEITLDEIPANTPSHLSYLNVSSVTDTDFHRLSEFSELKTVFLGSAPQLESIAGIENLKLKTLAVLHAPKLTALDEIRSSKESLESLYIFSSGLIEISVLKQLKNLKSVDLFGCNVTDISPLISCKKIERLGLYGCPISDLRPLAKLPALKHLTISPSVKLPEVLKGLKDSGKLRVSTLESEGSD